MDDGEATGGVKADSGGAPVSTVPFPELTGDPASTSWANCCWHIASTYPTECPLFEKDTDLIVTCSLPSVLSQRCSNAWPKILFDLSSPSPSRIPT